MADDWKLQWMKELDRWWDQQTPEDRVAILAKTEKIVGKEEWATLRGSSFYYALRDAACVDDAVLMDSGAEEYEEIMASQDAMNP